MGCVSGTTRLSLNRAGKGFSTNISWAYDAMHGYNKHPKSNWNSDIPTYAQSFVDGRVRLQKVEDIIQSGIKETITLTTAFGRKIRLTADHKILTDDGWIEAQNMLGRELFVVGGRHLPTIGIEAIKHEINKSLGSGRFIDKDGYVRVVAAHPRANRSGHVYEHLLIAEREFGEIPQDYEVHHKDGIKTHNDPSNLELLTVEEHRSLEAKKSGFGTFGVYRERVVDIKINGPEMTYDLVMEAPHHNFAANDIIVHNCMKTTTAEWLMQMKLKHIPNPRVLIITTKSGKGTYFESMAEVLPDWDVFSVSPQKFQIVVGHRPAPFNIELPNPLYMRPVAVVAHYHCFTNRACVPKQRKGANGLPKVTEDGTFVMDIPRCNVLMRMHWDMVIIDEAHRIKNPDAQWTRNIKHLRAQFKHIMTGTGFINNPAEIWSLLNFLFPDVYKSYWKFREKYCLEDDYSGYRKVIGIKSDMEDEFRELVHKVGVRRRMLEVFPNIAEPIETVIPVELNPTQKRMYDEIKDELYTLDQAGTPLHSANVLSMLNRLRQICVATPEVTDDYYDYKQERRIISVELKEPSSKLDAAMEIIEGLEWDQENKDQVVVFSNFKDPLKLLEKRLEKANIPYIHLRSEDNDKDRYEKWHEIWPRKEHRVFLCTLAVGSESINLASAHRAIFLDQSWSPKDNSQAIGRIYRPGQTGVAQIIYIRAEGTVDYRILSANEEKKGWFNSVFGIINADEDEDETDIAD